MSEKKKKGDGPNADADENAAGAAAAAEPATEPAAAAAAAPPAAPVVPATQLPAAEQPAPGAPPQGFLARLRLRAEPSVGARLLLGGASLGLLLLVWTLLTLGASEDRIISRTLLPSPMETLAAFPDLWFEAALTRNVAASLWRVLQGFGLAVLIGGPLGVLAGTFPKLGAFIAPVSVFGRNVPISALVPLTIVWFGIDEMQKFMFIFIASVMFVVFDAGRAVASVHERYVQTAFTLGAKPLQIFRKVLVPLALPEVFGSLRLLFGVAFGYIILAEMINAEYGLGHLILIAQRRGKTEWVYLILAVITLVAYGIDRILLWLQKVLFPWKEAA